MRRSIQIAIVVIFTVTLLVCAQPEENNWSKLMIEASKASSTDEIDRLISEGSNINETDKDGWTPLICAAYKNPNPLIIKHLVKRGAVIDFKATYRYDRKWTAVMFAANRNNLEAIKALVEAGANVNDSNKDGLISGETVLMVAAEGNPDTKVIDYLILNGADIKALDSIKANALLYASRSNPNPEMIEKLIDAGLSVDYRDRNGRTAIMVAEYNNISVLRTLINREANVDDWDRNGESVLMHHAFTNKNPEAIELLIKEGANIWDTDEAGCNALMCAAMNNNREVVSLLVNSGYYKYIDIADDDQMTALHYAAEYNTDVAVSEILIASGATVDYPDKDRETPLMKSAARNENHLVTMLLLQKGAYIDYPSAYKVTPLMFAAWLNSNPEVTRLLIKAGASIDRKSSNGMTALMLAARNSESEEVVRLLLQAGANPRLKDLYGSNAIDLIKKNEHLVGTTIYKELLAGKY